MPTLQNTLWCHKFPPPVGTSWGLSSRKLLCYSIILDYGNIVGDSSQASSIKCITANSAAAVALQKAGWCGPWLPQSSLSACDAMLSENVRCCHSRLPCTLFQHGQATLSTFCLACLTQLASTHRWLCISKNAPKSNSSISYNDAQRWQVIPKVT